VATGCVPSPTVRCRQRPSTCRGARCGIAAFAYLPLLVTSYAHVHCTRTSYFDHTPCWRSSLPLCRAGAGAPAGGDSSFALSSFRHHAYLPCHCSAPLDRAGHDTDTMHCCFSGPSFATTHRTTACMVHYTTSCAMSYMLIYSLSLVHAYHLFLHYLLQTHNNSSTPFCMVDTQPPSIFLTSWHMPLRLPTTIVLPVPSSLPMPTHLTHYHTAFIAYS